MQELTRDVAIVGAGATGLSAARALTRAGHTVAVLEARDRVGGRTWTDTVEGARLEIGGQWVSPDQTALIALIDELGLELFSRYRDGDTVYVSPDGGTTRLTGDETPAAPATATETERLVALLDDLAAEVDPAAPWAHPRAAELDSVSFSQWLIQQSEDPDARDAVALWIAGGMLTKPAHSFSALQAALMAASTGAFRHIVDEDFLLDRRIITGMQSVSEAMAAELPEDVVLSCPVREIHWDESGVTVVGQEATVRARRVIVAVPPNLYSRIGYIPPLPRRKHQAHQHQSMGLVIKVHAVYDTPFWRAEGLSGTCFNPAGLVQEVYDNTNHGDERGTLVGFVPDEKADTLFALGADERRSKILASIADALGPAALNPTVYYESDWGSEEWTRGAYAASYDLGGLHRYGPDQNEPVGPLYFASSDIAGPGYQHVDGAVRIGTATAERIAASLAEEPAAGRIR
ncbi:NAD(P)/FAD-dependent oxidoreductase [Tsukamurella sp. 8F]|uniref:flavin monoamine oxidase family protein n=1 Tax=unclassified Tsukamurella TaxID=2633480 RepID=UPI0023B9C01E|nr:MULTISPECIES: NAD(P)/FAD-dependent oxidoreductase [unclassified Tsukamurella]MDF0530787.1 NAD(P)/FAD-dependent oxidoreductase [Tsukamurella sp. 8J]MDF0588313.1 NAD(P)/FAD-dependent oxidoreductase [Tsukamurella sp. 8F]